MKVSDLNLEPPAAAKRKYAPAKPTRAGKQKAPIVVEEDDEDEPEDNVPLRKKLKRLVRGDKPSASTPPPSENPSPQLALAAPIELSPSTNLSAASSSSHHQSHEDEPLDDPQGLEAGTTPRSQTSAGESEANPPITEPPAQPNFDFAQFEQILDARIAPLSEAIQQNAVLIHQNAEMIRQNSEALQLIQQQLNLRLEPLGRVMGRLQTDMTNNRRFLRALAGRVDTTTSYLADYMHQLMAPPQPQLVLPPPLHFDDEENPAAPDPPQH